MRAVRTITHEMLRRLCIMLEKLAIHVPTTAD